MVTVAQSPGDLLFGKTRQAVLALLLTRPDESFHLRQIVRLTGAALGPAQRELANLSAAGIVIREPRGQQVFYRANTRSPIYPELRGLIEKTVGVAGVLRDALVPLQHRIRSAFIFGSVARGTQRQQSDIDLLVVGDVSFTELAAAIAQPQQRLGREINPTLYRPAEFARKLAARHHFLTQVTKGPKIFILGSDDELRRVATQRVDSRARDKSAGSRRAARRHRS